MIQKILGNLALHAMTASTLFYKHKLLFGSLNSFLHLCTAPQPNHTYRDKASTNFTQTITIISKRYEKQEHGFQIIILIGQLYHFLFKGLSCFSRVASAQCEEGR